MPALIAAAGIDAIVIALVAMILAVAAFTLFRPLITGGLAQVPLVGGWLAANSDLILLRIYAGSLSWVYASISPLTDVIARVRWAVVLTVDGVVATVESGWAATWRVRYIALPLVEQQMVAYTGQLFGQALQYAQGLHLQALQYAQGLHLQALQYAAQLFGQALQYTQQQAAAQTAYAQALDARETTYVQALDARETTYVQALVGQETAYAQQLAAGATAFTLGALASAEAYAGQIGVSAEGYARQLLGEGLRYTDQATTAATAVAAAATSAVATRVTELEDSPCQRFCDPLGQLGGLLQGLEDAGLLAALLALVAEARTHPHQVQELLADTFTGPLHDSLAELGLGPS